MEPFKAWLVSPSHLKCFHLPTSPVPSWHFSLHCLVQTLVENKYLVEKEFDVLSCSKDNLFIQVFYLLFLFIMLETDSEGIYHGTSFPNLLSFQLRGIKMISYNYFPARDRKWKLMFHGNYQVSLWLPTQTLTLLAFKASFIRCFLHFFFYKTKINIICFLKTTVSVTISNIAWIWELKLYSDACLIRSSFLYIPFMIFCYASSIVMQVNPTLSFPPLFASHWGSSSHRSAHTLFSVRWKPKIEPTTDTIRINENCFWILVCHLLIVWNATDYLTTLRNNSIKVK